MMTGLQKSPRLASRPLTLSGQPPILLNGHQTPTILPQRLSPNLITEEGPPLPPRNPPPNPPKRVQQFMTKELNMPPLNGVNQKMQTMNAQGKNDLP